MTIALKLTEDEVAQLERIPGNTYRVTYCIGTYVHVPIKDWRVVLAAIGERPALIAMARRTADAEAILRVKDLAIEALHEQDHRNRSMNKDLSVKVIRAEAALASERQKVAKLRETLTAVQNSLAKGKPFEPLDCLPTVSSVLAETAPDASAPADVGVPPPLVFTYRNHRGEIAERRVRPISVRFGSTEWHHEPQWLLRAFDLDKGAEREFAMADVGAPAAEADPYAEGLEAAARIAVEQALSCRKHGHVVYPDRPREAAVAFGKAAALEVAAAAIRAEIKARGDGPGDGGITRDPNTWPDAAPIDLCADDGWCRDMSRAPRDGTRFDVWIVPPSGSHLHKRPRRFTDASYTTVSDGCFLIDQYGNVIDWKETGSQYASHWRPLPPPPAAQDDA